MKGLKGRKIGVLMGGLSAEREISLRTGEAVFKALKELGYRAVKIDVGRDVVSRIMEEAIDVAFIALHGRYGEDGTIQGLLEIMGIPYTGSGVAASAIAMNKVMAKRVFIAEGLPTPRFSILSTPEEVDIPYPFMIKPADQGSTIGVTKVEREEDLEEAMKEALSYSDTVYVEEFIQGQEVTFGIVDGRVFPAVEIRPRSSIYDYRAKYSKGMTEYLIPPALDEDLLRRAREVALRAFEVIGCRGAVRVDMVVDGRGPWLLEVNTIPGMTETSLLPRAAMAGGIDFHSLVEMILLGARLGG